jgi:hypothetical protein
VTYMDGPVNLTRPGDLEELTEMIRNEGSELAGCCTASLRGPQRVQPRSSQSRNGDITGSTQKGRVGSLWPTLPLALTFCDTRLSV